MLLYKFLSLLVLLTTLTPAWSAPPRDSCSELEGFSAFREQLKGAIDGRDRTALEALLADEVKTPGGSWPRAEAMKMFFDGEESWIELAGLLTLREGCVAFQESSAVLPGDWRGSLTADDLGMDALAFVTGTRVALRGGPSLEAEVIARLDWAVVGVSYETRSEPWVPVKLQDGRRGFVSKRYLPMRANWVFQRTPAGWRLRSVSSC